jgi:hypothetical protein
MRKQIILSLTAGALLSLGALWAGCDDDGGGTIAPKMDMAHAVDKDGGGDGDMTVVPDCIKTPSSNSDFLNSCAPESVVGVPIEPEFPEKTPNGVLPSLP